MTLPDNVSVQSLQRTFNLLEILSRNPDGLTLGELSLRTGLHKSTVHRLLSSLIALGYVRKRGVYVLTPRLFEIGARVIEHSDVVEAAKPLLRGMSAHVGETVNLIIRDGTDALCVFKAECHLSVLRISTRVGRRRPLYCTAVGKAILATLPDDEIQAVWENSEIVAFTPNTITGLPELMNDLRRTRNLGYAIDNEECETGVRCIAGALTDYSGTTSASFSISAPAARMSPERLQSLAAEIRGVQGKLSHT